ncbi:MAG: collagen-like protein [Bradyrhizobiaceae bacterium]|nr:collagen-like protein [Bradyrhizobiaceae bacterium]
MNRHSLVLQLVVICALSLSCTGPAGPQGPAGQDGKNGSSGEKGHNYTLIYDDVRIETDERGYGLQVLDIPEISQRVLDSGVVVCEYRSPQPSTWITLPFTWSVGDTTNGVLTHTFSLSARYSLGTLFLSVDQFAPRDSGDAVPLVLGTIKVAIFEPD